jgi:hypothetical protein
MHGACGEVINGPYFSTQIIAPEGFELDVGAVFVSHVVVDNIVLNDHLALFFNHYVGQLLADRDTLGKGYMAAKTVAMASAEARFIFYFPAIAA